MPATDEVLEADQSLSNSATDINAVDNNGETAMHGAAYKNLPKVVEFLASTRTSRSGIARTNRDGRR